MKNVVLLDVALVRTDVSEEYIASIIRAKRISELGTLAVTSKRSTLGSVGSNELHGFTSQKTCVLQ
jgi:hypothetical protein